MPRRRTHRFTRLLIGLVLHLIARPKLALAGSLLVLVGCGLLAYGRLDLNTDQDELFSTNDPIFKRYVEYNKDFPEHQAAYVFVHAADPATPPTTGRWIAVADAITAALQADKSAVRAVDSHVPLEQFGKQAILLQDSSKLKDDLRQIGQLSTPFQPGNPVTRRLLGPTPIERFLTGARGRVPDADSAFFISAVAGGLTDVLVDVNATVAVGKQVVDVPHLKATPATYGYYYERDDDSPAERPTYHLLIRVFERENYASKSGVTDVIEAIRATTKAAADKFPQFNVDLTGRPVLEADEMKTTDEDARKAEIAALSAVFLGLVFLLRSIWLAVAAEIALLIGIGWTFGWATVATAAYNGKTRGDLNLLSLVFLIALTGIGMDYLIQVLTRYRREAARGRSPKAIWTAVFKYVSAPINTATLGAGGAFLVAVFTNFRGAAELGLIAGGGLVLCLVTCYVVLPPLLTLFPAKVDPAAADRHDEPAVGTAPADAVGWRRHRWLILPAVWAALILAGIPYARRANFDHNLLGLQVQSLQSVKLVHKLQTWSDVVLSHDPADLRRARAALAELPIVQPMDTIQNSVLTPEDNYAFLTANPIALLPGTDYDPVTAADLPRLVTAAKRLADGHRRTPFAATAGPLDDFAAAVGRVPADVAVRRLNQWQSTFLGELNDLLSAFHPAPFAVEQLPATLRDHLVGLDGTLALNVSPTKDLWDQDNLKEFTTGVERAVAALPDAPPTTGVATDVYHTTGGVAASFYHATAYALALIFVLVLLDLRNLKQTVLAISVLAMGLPMLIALMGLFGISWNFANFFGLPILIGAGHEYGVFMVHRFNEACGDPHRPWRRWDVSDRALLLCGYVTSISFGFFWFFGRHLGLKSLGLVMAIGIACIYLATLCVLRPLLLWKLAARDKACRAAA